MPIKAKYNGSYKDITDLMNVDESIDYVLAKTSSSYKRVYTATRSIEDAPPTTFKSIKSGANLTDYRIYGQTSRNLFSSRIEQGSFDASTGALDGSRYRVRSHADDYIYLLPGNYELSASGVDYSVIYGYDSPDVNTFNSNLSRDRWVNLPTTITINTSAYYKFGFRRANNPAITPSDISNIMLNTGSTALPYEPYGESVGDLVTSGEHAGEYKVPVTVEGKNILPMSTTPISTDVDDFHCEYDGMGTIKLTALTDNAVLSGFTVPLSKEFTIPLSVGQGGTGCWQMNNDAAYMNVNNSPSFSLGLRDNTYIRDYWGLNIINRVNFNYVSMGGTNINSIIIQTVVGAATNIQSGQTLTISPAFVENVTVQVPFEPYRTPITTPIYLPEPIKMVGDEAEYIDYGEQKQHRVRKNLWAGVVEQGGVSQSGSYNSDSNRIRSKNVPLEPGTYTISTNLLIRMAYAFNDDNKIGVCINSASGNHSRSFTVPAGANNISIGMMKVVDGVQVDITPSDFIWGQIEKGSEATTYEPYITNTELDVTLPALPTLPGTNVLSVETEVQPSKIDITGHIKTISGGS